MLHKRQAQLLRVIHDANDSGARLTYGEMATLLGMQAKGNIARMVGTLVKRGFLSKANPEGRLRQIRRIETITRGEPVSDHPVVLFIHNYQLRHDGASPSIREIGAGVGWTSIKQTQQEIAALETQGSIRRFTKPRAEVCMIEVVKRPEVNELAQS